MIEVITSRAHRTWAEKLMLWQRAYQTKICDGHHEVVGRGPTREAAQEAAERQWVAKAQREYEANRPNGIV